MDWESLVLRDGDRVEAWGRLVRTDAGTFFEPPVPSLAIATPLVAPPSGFGVAVVGADLEDVERRKEFGGRVEGYATLAGRWVRDRLHVDSQTHRRLPGPPPLRVVAGDFSRSDVEAVREQLDRRGGEWKIWATYETTDERGRPSVEVELTLVRPGFAAWLAEQPEGLVLVDAWLTPVHLGRTPII